MFASGEMASKAKDAGVHVIDPTTIEDLGSNRQRARKIAKQHDFFLSEVPHMGSVGRYLGQSRTSWKDAPSNAHQSWILQLFHLVFGPRHRFVLVTRLHSMAQLVPVLNPSRS